MLAQKKKTSQQNVIAHKKKRKQQEIKKRKGKFTYRSEFLIQFKLCYMLLLFILILDGVIRVIQIQ